MISTLRWYIDRLSIMSVRELYYRLEQKIQSTLESYFSAGKKPPEIELFITRRILENRITRGYTFPAETLIFGKPFNYLADEISWQYDLFSKKSFPLVFSKNISIRKDPELSAKNVWEVNRLQFLPQICLNYRQTGDPEYLGQFVRIMNSWIDGNPYLMGINWYSNLEINIRLINWFFCWEILDVSSLIEENHEFGSFVADRWIPSIHQHCQFSYSNPSRYSSANNHLVAEYAGLFIASSKWKFSESARWLSYSKKGLEKEIEAQHSDGVNKEEAAEYIQFVTDFFMLSFVVGLKTGNHFSTEYTMSLKKIFEYILAIIDLKGNIPNYGDGDDGKVLNLSQEVNFNNFLSLMTSASVIFSESKFKLRTTSFDLKNEILFGKKGKEIYESLPGCSLKAESVFYKNEGHHIFRDRKDGKEIYLHFNSAPLGYLSMAAHGHADALSFILSINGHCIFADPGTYSYHVSKEWRDYFVSTMAHNTICIDNKNQANHAGDTLWLQHYKCTLVSQTAEGSLESVKAEHNGYRNIKHTREVLFNKHDRSFTISDEILKSDNTEQKCCLMFHIHPRVSLIRLTPNKFLLTHSSGIRISVLLEDFSFCSIIRGQVDPVLGWFSGSFMQKEPCSVLFAAKTIKQSFNSVTKILIHEY